MRPRVGRLAPMSTHRLLVAAAAVGALAGCAPAADSGSADIARVSEVAASFGPDYTVTQVEPTGIDPALLAGQDLPEHIRFDPPECAELAGGPAPDGELQGNMAAVTAEGDGIRYITIAMETSEEIPLRTPGENCTKVSFAGGQVRGTVESVPAPPIEDVQTVGTHRVMQAQVEDAVQTGEVYTYLAHFGNFRVIVTANPLVLPDQPVVPVDTERAQQLLTAAVAAIRDAG